MSLRKRLSQFLPDTIPTEENKNIKGRTLNNFCLNISKYKLKSKESHSIKLDSNYYMEKIQRTPKSYNIGYYTEKTEYSSHINDCLSKIQTNTEKRPLYYNITLNENNTKELKTQTLNNYSSSKNIFNKNKTNQKKDNNYKTSLKWFRKNNHYYKVNKFDMENIIKFSNTFENFRTPKTKKSKYLSNSNNTNNKKNVNNRFNSLNFYIDNYIRMDINKLVNRYIPNFKDYFSKTDYTILTQKRKKLLTEKEKIKTVFKDTKLMMCMCDYINSSFSKIKNEKRMKLNSLNQQIKEVKSKNKYIKSINEEMKNNLIPIKNIFSMKKNEKLYKAKKISKIYKNGNFYKSFNSLNSLIHH
jgi:hypothetical protein